MTKEEIFKLIRRARCVFGQDWEKIDIIAFMNKVRNCEAVISWGRFEKDKNGEVKAEEGLEMDICLPLGWGKIKDIVKEAPSGKWEIVEVLDDEKSFVGEAFVVGKKR